MLKINLWVHYADALRINVKKLAYFLQFYFLRNILNEFYFLFSLTILLWQELLLKMSKFMENKFPKKVTPFLII